MWAYRVLALAGLVGSLSSCDSEVETEGFLLFAFEASSFLPCGDEEAWWVVATDELMRRYAALELPSGHSAYARLRGERSDRGHYGHLGAYRYEFEVTETVSLRQAQPTDCD
jgi:hypothetical protein